jgi:hypothetical protein
VGAALAAGEERRSIPLGLELTEGGQDPQLTACPLIQRSQEPIERRLVRERNGQEIRGYIPWLIGDNAQLHYKALRLAGAGQ